MQNTMVRGGYSAGEKMKRGKGLKNASFWAINSKKIASPRLPQTYLSGGKNESQYISL